jgi:hypothetical protein
MNFGFRLLIYFKSVLFNFSDYLVYLSGIDLIHDKGSISIMSGNYLFTISYIGYFAKYILGNINYFYIMDCFLGTITTFLLSKLILQLSGSVISGVITALILTFYTEFMTFSSVFYSPIIMLFLLSLFVWSLYLYFRNSSVSHSTLNLVLLVFVFLMTFLFKPELIFFPIFLFLFAFFFIKKDRIFFKRTILISFVLFAGIGLFLLTGVFSNPKDHPIANDFIFFGHTNYGGDGGEGSFVYHENEERYNKALTEWCVKNKIVNPDQKEINQFQEEEIFKFIAHSPFSWIKLQLTKFFRTFGVVPETTSFKILYKGLLKGNLWLTSFIVVTPVAIIILLFILFFNLASLNKLFNHSTLQVKNLTIPHNDHQTQQTEVNKYFFYIYILLFLYYIIGAIFLGQYQERYRMPIIIVFIIPLLSFFIVTFDKKQFFNKVSLSIKGGIITLFLVIWMFQAKKAISNNDRFINAIESVKGINN